MHYKKIVQTRAFPAIVFICTSLILAFCATRGFLFSKGLIEAGDLAIQYYLKTAISRMFTMWDSYYGMDNTFECMRLPSIFWYIFFSSSEIVQRLRYFILFYLCFFNISIITYYFLIPRFKRMSCFVASIAAACIFVFNPWFISRISHYNLLWGYSMTPLIFYFSYKAVYRSFARQVVVNALIAGIFIVLSISFHMIAFNTLAALFFMAVACLLNFNELGFKNNSFRFLVFTIVIFLCVVSLGAYWMLPYFSFFSAGHSIERTVLFRTQDAISQNIISLSSIVTLIPNKEWGDFIVNSLPSGLKGIYAFTRYSFLVFAFLAIVMSYFAPYKNRIIRFVFFSALLLIFSIRGPQGLLGNLYIWIVFNAPILSAKGALLRDLTKLIGFLSFFYALMVSYTIAIFLDYITGARNKDYEA